MDNNQNFGQQSQQPVNNAFGQQPVNNGFPQQQPMNNMYQQFAQQAPKQPKVNVMELIALICAGVGFIMVVFGTIFTCNCSASKWGETAKFSLSPIFILTIFGVVAAVAGIVLAIVALKQKDAQVKADKLAKLAIILGAAGAIFGLLPLFTICGYNCALNNTEIDAMGSWDDIYNDLIK